MSYLFALIDEDGDYCGSAYSNEDDAEDAAICLQWDAIRQGIDCKISYKIVNSRNLPDSVEIIA